MSTTLPPSSIPLLTTVRSFREWRQRAFDDGKSVGFVATMGALHEGHLSLGKIRYVFRLPSESRISAIVRRSIEENDQTVLSIFVNPAQFAPHEDLATYPSTLAGDLALLSSLLFRPSNIIVFLPSAQEMYPSGITQEKEKQKGTFVEVVGFSHQMEGQSRPLFFRGVATVVTKLFNVVQVSPSLYKRDGLLIPSTANEHVFRTKGHSASAHS
jgi:pantoate--beta-alanine ligase